MNALSGKTAVVVGASRGLGHAIASAFAKAGATVIGVSRTAAAVDAPGVHTELADASDATVPARLLDRHDPDIVVLVAGAIPYMRPLQEQTWETFEVNWQTDVRMAFHWLREILLKPLKPGSRVVVFSSGAALGGSPLSGGYAGAKATQRFLTAYAQTEAARAGLDLTFTAVLPRFAPAAGVGMPAIQAYAARQGTSTEQFLAQLGPTVTPESTGAAITDLVTRPAGDTAPAYMLTAAGLQALPV